MKLSDRVTNLNGIGSSTAKNLELLGIVTIKDLLTHFPRKYVDTSDIKKISEILALINPEEIYNIKGSIHNFKNIFTKSRKAIQQATLSDGSGDISCMWFNQPYLKNTLRENETFVFSGKIKVAGRKITFFPTAFEKYKDNQELTHLGRITPEYNLTSTVKKNWFRKKIKELIDLVDLGSFDTDEILLNNGVQINAITTAIKEVHFPTNEKALSLSKNFLSKLEIANIHLKIMRSEQSKLKQKSYIIESNNVSRNLVDLFELLPYKLTKDQSSALENLILLFKEDNASTSLIQGDVGSGKTIIAIASAYLFAKNKVQTAVLVPTTVLAEQHFNSFSKIFDKLNIKVALVTGSTKKDIEDADVYIGTTAVLARKKNLFTKLGLVVVDEQHRFGVRQREELIKDFIDGNEFQPHLINMTATPIPRTIAETFFTNINVISINTKPAGRLPIKTFIVPQNKRADCYNWIDNRIKETSEQIYWICPLIDESDAINAKSAKEVFTEVSKQFKDKNVELLHGKLSNDEKNNILEDFQNHKIDILVSTSVIEVGIDVPNANTIIIESAERFGLAQLHQLRGRVGRSDKQSHCFLFATNEESISSARLDILTKSNNGLEIAEFDLELRGPGEVYGTKQSGIPNLKIANLRNLKLIQESKLFAQKLLSENIYQIPLFS